ncbi:modular serine protease-like [Teleopsis dalmanni]|uniref:modular serine protease-like n=1 Tax=Teleopsis dalmanni TaxID=139649 RepID=UPI0018CE2C4E|nr:modular serine protease-like [Teleopsis dalmanni]
MIFNHKSHKNISILQLKLLLCLLFYIKTVFADCDEFLSWKCDNEQCIDISKLCNGAMDCVDGSDETAENCIHLRDNCPGYAYRCTYGACVKGHSQCNGIIDCVDGSDELPILCQKNSTNFRGTCSSDEKFQCKSGECISIQLICDGTINCSDGSDESVEVCQVAYCPSYAFRCGYGACIQGTYKCDGVKQCADGSDEAAQLCGRPRVYSNTAACKIPNDKNLIAREVLNMAVVFRSGATVSKNKLVKFECNTGYWRLGVGNSVCGENGWTELVPKCIKCCDAEELLEGYSTSVRFTPPTGTTTNAFCNDRTSVLDGTKAYITCANFYEEPPGKNFHNTMDCDNGKWNTNRIACDMNCGQIQQTLVPYSKNGIKVNVTSVPWHASIYQKYDFVEYKFICSGSIIGPRLIVSAAHCFWDLATKSVVDTTIFAVAVGKYVQAFDNDDDNNGVQKRNVTKIIIREDYKGAATQYKNDFAILVLEEHIQFTDVIRPICWSLEENAGREVPSNVYVYFAGWDNVNKDNPELQRVTMETKSYGDCKRLESSLANDKFCLSDANFGIACHGDSGSGVFMKIAKGGSEYYKLIGIISHAPKRAQDCANNIVTATNVKYFGRDFEDIFKKEHYKYL